MIHSEFENGELRFVLQHERFDYTNASQFSQSVTPKLDEAFDSLVIDLVNVCHIDSTAISALLKIQEALPENRLPVVLRNIRPELICVIELMRLHRVFALEPLPTPSS